MPDGDHALQGVHPLRRPPEFLLRPVGARSRREQVVLDRRTLDLASAREAVREVLQALLATIRLNESGVREDIDTEFLHDFRVAVRRTRSALSQVKGVFGGNRFEQFRDEFKWLGGLSGRLRDLDVYILSLPEYRALREGIGFLEMCRDVERAVAVSLQPIDLVGSEAVILFQDILRRFPGWGSSSTFAPGP